MYIDTRLERIRKDKARKHYYRSHQEIYEEEMIKTQQIRERLARIVEKFQIDVSESAQDGLPNDRKYRLDVNADDKIFYGYMNNRFFSKEVLATKQVERAMKKIRKIIDKVSMKEELNLLAKLIHNNMEMADIQSLIGRLMKHITQIDWNRDRAIYTDQKIPRPDA